MKPRRGYDDREVAIILEKAADLQQVALVPAGARRSLDEIRTIAAEAGMDPAAVDAAAAGMVEPEIDRWPLIGRAPRMELTCSVAGVLDDEGRQQLLGALRRALDARGRATQTAGTLELRHLGLLGRELVVITARRGRTHIEVRGRYRRGLVASFAGGGLAGGLASVGVLELLHVMPHLGDWGVPLVLGAAVAAGRAVWGWFSGTKERSLRRLAQKAAEIVEDAPPPALPPRGDSL
jgi:hypothetical protein